MRGSDRDENSPLSGAGVLLTRPAGQNAHLSRRLTTLGASVLIFPAIEIRAMQPSPKTSTRLVSLFAYDLVIFISPNAVTFAQPLLGVRPEGGVARFAATGAGTARALRDVGLGPDYVPPRGSGSRALLSIPALQWVDRQTVLIVRGVGGREHLAGSLRARGAHVDYAEVYQRVCPSADSRELEGWLAAHRLDAVLVTSRAALTNLQTMLGQERYERVLDTQLIVSSPRMREQVVSLGARHRPIVAVSASDTELVAALVDWWRQRQPAG